MTDVYQTAGEQWGVDPLLLQAIEQVESRGKTAATSPKGAEGNMQFMPATAASVGVANTRVPEFSVPGAAKLLDGFLRGSAKGDLTTALRMYHGGENRAKWGAENSAYPGKVAAAYAALKAKTGQQPQVYAQTNPANMSDDELRKTLGLDGNSPSVEDNAAPSSAAPDPANMSDDELRKTLGLDDATPPGVPKPGETDPVTNQKVQFASSVPETSPVTEAINYASGVLGSVTHGLSFGLDAPVNNLMARIDPAYARLKEGIDKNQQAFEANHPVVSAVAEGVGSVPTYVVAENALSKVIPETVATGPLSKAGNVLKSSLRNAAVSGALSAGTSGGDINAAEKGAAVGAVVPPTFSAIGSILRSVTAPIMARLSGSAAQRQAVNQIGNALSRDQMTPADIKTNLLQLGPDATLADAGGTNVRRLGETVANMPGEAAKQAETFLEGRAAGQAGRVNAAIKAATGSDGDFHAAMGDLAQKRATEAAPLYDKAFSQPVTMAQVRPLQDFITDRIGQDALQRGMRIIELENLANRRLFNPESYGVVRSGDSGKFIINPDVLDGKQAPSLRLLDAVKRGYDEIVEGYRDPTTGRLNLNQEGRAINDVRAKYNSMLRQEFPDYGQALDAWAGPSRAMDALSMGRRALTNDPEINTKAISGMSDTEKQFFLSGMARALKDKVEGAADGADATRKIFGNQLIRDRIKAALGSDNAFDEFSQTMEREAAFARTRNEVLKNSPTARRVAGQHDLGFDAVTPAMHVAHGNPLGAMLHVAHQGLNAMTAAPPATNPILGRMLFTPGVDDELLQALARNRNPLAFPIARTAATTTSNRLEAPGR